MHPVRQVICFVVAAALFCAGLDILYDEAFVAQQILGRAVVIGLFLLFIGALWLWVDFGAPLWRRLTAPK
ncbi:MAG TPA: hypothetical protein VG841_03370 [Caulobacterales bacterium]|nr:hypothetical protein [Caulobacterales bacterium]